MQNKSAAPVPPAMNDTTDESLTLLELQSHQNNAVSELHRAMSSLRLVESYLNQGEILLRALKRASLSFSYSDLISSSNSRAWNRDPRFLRYSRRPLSMSLSTKQISLQYLPCCFPVDDFHTTYSKVQVTHPLGPRKLLIDEL